MRRSALFVATLLLSTSCQDVGDRTGVSGRITAGPGLILIERGPLHGGSFQRGGVIGADGRYDVELPEAGTWGLHLYVDGYYYLPVEVQVTEGETKIVMQSDVHWEHWEQDTGQSRPLQPDDPGSIALLIDWDLSRNPTCSSPSVTETEPGVFEVAVDVSDPDNNLSNMVLVHDPATGMGIRLNPPGPPVDGNYPNGIYRVTVFLADDADLTKPWYFVAADHECKNSAIPFVFPQRMQ